MTLDEKVDRILAIVADIQKRMASGGGVASKTPTADDRDLDGQHGDPVVRKDPPRWDGDSFVGCKYSECSADYLEITASFLVWKAGKNDEDEAKAKASGDEEAAKKANKYAFYARKDAARAAGWAKRIRDGYTPPAAPEYTDGGPDVPF